MEEIIRSLEKRKSRSEDTLGRIVTWASTSPRMIAKPRAEGNCNLIVSVFNGIEG